MSDTTAPIEVFYAFAPEDEPWVQQLEKHLSLLQHQQLIATWHARLIQAGTDWQHVIDTYQQNASVILLLISPDFLASDYCYGVEMKQALEREQTKGVKVIPIPLRPVDWRDAPFAHLHPLPSNATFLPDWTNIDRSFTEVTAGLRRTFEDVSLLTLAMAQADVPALWNVPFAHNPFFLGRDDLLGRLRTQLQRESAGKHFQRQAICGLGGMGKTQLAVEYAYRFRQDYQAVFWIRAESNETLNASFTELATLLDLPEKQTARQEILILAVKRWLHTHRGWLLILDNADEPALCMPFLPQGTGGHVLLTTRATALRHLGIAFPLVIESLEPESGALLLLQRAGLLQPGEGLADAPPQDQDRAFQITQEFGGLPLALNQAGAYLEATGTGLATYQQIYQQHRMDLLQESRGLEHDHPEPVATTWLLSFQRVEARDPAAAELLRLCAFLAPDAIGETLLMQGGIILGPWLAPVMADQYLLEKALEALRAYSLVTRDAARKTLMVHRLVQSVVRDSLHPEVQQQWMQRVVELLARSFPSADEVAHWSACEQLLPHALLGSHWIEQAHLISPQAAQMLDATGLYLNRRARYGEALPLFQRALSIREQVLGASHPDTAQTLRNLAFLWHHQGRYEDANMLLLRVLAIQKPTLGLDHPATATSLNALALLYRDQCKYAEAELLYQQALAIRERVLGPEHPHTAHSLSNLAWLYRDQGRYAEAAPLYERSLAIRQRVLGVDHPDTATSLNGLALLYQRQGRDEEARPLYEQALAIREHVLGMDHPQTAQSLNSLALLYLARGNQAQAEPLLRRALEIRKRVLGPEHPDTAASLSNFGLLYQAQSKYTEAEALFRGALEIRERVLGPDHSSTATSLHHLAFLLQEQGNDVQAEPLFRQALAIRERLLGPDHPNTRKTQAQQQ